MTIDHEHANQLATAYAEAWNSGSPEAVAALQDGDSHD
jgi:hypothetical protein